MVKEIINKKEKSILIKTDYQFSEFKIEKHREYFYYSFIKNKNQRMGSCLFFNMFNGRKYYPKEITPVIVDSANGQVILKYE